MDLACNNFDFHIVLHRILVDIDKDNLDKQEKKHKLEKKMKQIGNRLFPVGIHCPPFWHGDAAQGLYGVVVVIRVSQQRPVNPGRHWQMATVPIGTHEPPFWQGFGSQGVAANQKRIEWVRFREIDVFTRSFTTIASKCWWAIANKSCTIRYTLSTI